MKTTFKISALVLAFAGFALGAKAQTTSTSTTTKTSTGPNGIVISVGADAGIPTGKLNDSYNWNIGA